MFYILSCGEQMLLDKFKTLNEQSVTQMLIGNL